MAPAKSTKAPAFQFYPKDFLADSKVQRMSLTEKGIYIVLLSNCWLEGSLPTDLRKLASMVGMKLQQFERVWPVTLEECFTVKGDRLVHGRLEAERKKQAINRAARAANGSLGGRPVGTKTKPAAFGSDHKHEPDKSTSIPISDLRSPSAEKSVRAQTPIGGMRNEHRAHAFCGRVCLPGFLFNEFISRRGGDDPHQVISDWALSVVREWAPDGPRKDDEPGDVKRFWNDRYEERWPPPAKVVTSRVPEWAR